ncbi:eukaryotic translation initiation factor 2A isoform 3 [Corchorus olitorius]|uniref:Eukaryotic translation initiation factor 2A isoform 3 n=1 Tax=Corchorus olitorius TaxID=93759 RepID=A0A1R3HG55_9ROSI|nr:eukaryotic translation initiation factor 2A isoform 3 [Corchorus olitorius]
MAAALETSITQHLDILVQEPDGYSNWTGPNKVELKCEKVHCTNVKLIPGTDRLLRDSWCYGFRLVPTWIQFTSNEVVACRLITNIGVDFFDTVDFSMGVLYCLEICGVTALELSKAPGSHVSATVPKSKDWNNQVSVQIYAFGWHIVHEIYEEWELSCLKPDVIQKIDVPLSML